MNPRTEKVIRYRIRVKQRLIEYKGGKCQRCSYDKPVPGAYHFHHLRDKLFEINGSTLGFERLKAEADKCLLLCANCHAEVHDEEWREKRDERLAFKKKKAEVRDLECPTCHEQFFTKSKTRKFCSRGCQHASMRC